MTDYQFAMLLALHMGTWGYLCPKNSVFGCVFSIIFDLFSIIFFIIAATKYFT